MTKKRHHFIPQAYLKSFCDDQGKLYVYRKDDPSKEIRLSPNNTGFHKYFYSQPTPDGGVDHDRLEDCFSECEAKWPPLVGRLGAGENVSDALDTIYAFIGLQRARVPAARDACERALAEMVKATMRQMDAAGELLPPPPGFEDIHDKVGVAIDPHQSIHAMVHVIKAVGELLGRIGIEVVRNETDVPFLTSDNPVLWFDSSLAESEMQPYAVHPNGPITLIFPVAPDLLIFGDTSKQEQFNQYGLVYSKPRDDKAIEMMNTLICRFAYESVYTSKPGFRELVKAHADTSPVTRTTSIPVPNGQMVHHQFVWGKRTRRFGRFGGHHTSGSGAGSGDTILNSPDLSSAPASSLPSHDRWRRRRD